MRGPCGSGALLALSLVLFSATVFGDYRVASDCIRSEAVAAEEEANTLRSWAEVYDSYRRYAHCDDGAIAEGYSSSVARLFTNAHADVSTLSAMASRDVGFQRFVLRHIDTSIPAKELAVIYEKVAHCPESAEPLCKEIKARIEELRRRP